MTMRGPYWRQSSRVESMIVSATGWSPKRAAIRWRWWSCRGVEAPASWLAASRFPALELCRARSRTTSDDALPHCLRRRSD